MLGGTALNVASVVAALGAKPALVSLVAQDAAGIGLREELTKRGIVAHVDGSTGANTGTYTCMIEPDGSLLVGMADMAIYEDFSAREFAPLAGSLSVKDWICVDTNLPPKQMQRLLQLSSARKVGLTVSKAKAPRLKIFADQLDLVFTNRVEVCSLCGFDDAATETKSNESIATALQQMGITSAVISDGTHNVTVIEPEKIQIIKVSPVKYVADVTGAGDALVGAALFALMCDTPLANAVEFGIKAAQATIQSKGALRSDLAKLIGLSGRAL